MALTTPSEPGPAESAMMITRPRVAHPRILLKHLLTPSALALALTALLGVSGALGVATAATPRANAAEAATKAAPEAATAATVPVQPGAVEWTAIGGNPDITFYADMASLTTGGGTTKLWTLVGSKTERSQGAIRFSSIKTWFEFDCTGPRIRELQTQFHAGPLGDGAVVGGYAETGPWEPVAEGTVKEGLSQIACPAPDSKPAIQAEKS